MKRTKNHGLAEMLPESSLKKLDALWTDWLKRKYKDQDLNSQEPGPRGKTLLAMYRPEDSCSDQREKDTMQFYYELEKKYFEEMKTYLRSIGLKTPLSGQKELRKIATIGQQ